MNSSVATLTFSGVITKNILDGLNNPITPLDASGSSGTGSTADVDTITSAVGMVDLLTGGKSLQNCSLNELMSIVSFLLLSSSQERKETEGLARRSNRDMATEGAKVKFQMGVEAAKETREAARTQAITQIVSGAMSVAMGVVSLGISAYGGFKAAQARNNNSAAGNTDSASAKIDPKSISEKYSAMAQTINSFSNGLSQIITGIGGIVAADHTFKADMIKNASDVIANCMQLANENASTLQQDMSDIKSYQSNVLNFLQTTLRNTYDTISQIARNI